MSTRFRFRTKFPLWRLWTLPGRRCEVQILSVLSVLFSICRHLNSLWCRSTCCGCLNTITFPWCRFLSSRSQQNDVSICQSYGPTLLQLPLLRPSHIKLVKVRKPWMKHFQDELSSLSNTFQQVFQQRCLETGFRDGLVQCDCGLCRGMPSTPSGCCNRRTQCQHEYFYILGLSEPLHSVRSIAIAVYSFFSLLYVYGRL